MTEAFAKQIETEARQAMTELVAAAKLKKGDVLVVGCSSSEMVGGHIGKDSSIEAARALYAGAAPVLAEKGIWLAAQCCEHLNRALILEREAAEKRIAELEAREIKPAKGEVLVVVSGFTGCGKSAIAGEIEIAMKAIGVPVKWTTGDAEKRMTGADWLTAIEMYKPTVRIVEVNVPRVAGIRIKGE